jgi:hypothetical protein
MYPWGVADSPFRQRHYRSDEARAIVREALAQASARPGAGLSQSDLERLLRDLGVDLDAPGASERVRAADDAPPLEMASGLGFFLAFFPLMIGVLLGVHHRPVGALAWLLVGTAGFLATHVMTRAPHLRCRVAPENDEVAKRVSEDVAVEEVEEAEDQRASSTARTVSSMDL